MVRRNLKAIKWLGTVPAGGLCTCCHREFKVPMTELKRVANAEQSLTLRFTEQIHTPGTENQETEVLTVLSGWKRSTQFREDEDWIFPSPVKLGRLPYSYTGYWRALQSASVAAAEAG